MSTRLISFTLDLWDFTYLKYETLKSYFIYSHDIIYIGYY